MFTLRKKINGEFKMINIRKDLEETKNIINGKISKNYGKIYLHSNELLKGIIPKLKLNNKSVLTILRSGDQIFHFYNGGAKKVDAIDINRLAIHYFYLRKWTIQYMYQYYPDKDMSLDFIRSVLSEVVVHSKEEEDSLHYWYLFVNEMEKENTDNLYNSGDNFSINRLYNFLTLRDKLFNVDIKLFNQNLFEDLFIDGKYDVIFTSNIADYATPTRENFEKYRDNLDSLLNENGIIISSNVLISRPTMIEKEVFGEKFDSAKFPIVDSEYIDCSPATVYMRKRSIK